MSNIFERAGDMSSTTADIRSANGIPDTVKDADVDSYMFAKMEKENVDFYMSEGMKEKDAKEKARAKRRSAERQAKEAAKFFSDLKDIGR